MSKPVVHWVYRSAHACGRAPIPDQKLILTHSRDKVTCVYCLNKIEEEIDQVAIRSNN